MSATTLRILHVNANKNKIATEIILQEAVERNIDIIAVQEPYLILEDPHVEHPTQSYKRSTSHPSFIQEVGPSHSPNERPQTVIYTSKFTSAQVTPVPYDGASQHSDLLSIEVKFREMDFQLLNLYNQKTHHEKDTFTTHIYPTELEKDALIVGDFNAHHPDWEPAATRDPRSDRIVEWMDAEELRLLNVAGKGTFWRRNMEGESIIDLSFASPSIANKVSNWQILNDLGSDHNGVLIELQSNSAEDMPSAMQQDRFNTKKADWDKFSSTLKLLFSQSEILKSPEYLALTPSHELCKKILLQEPCPETILMDKVAEEVTQIIQQAARASIPLVPRGSRGKPWWNEDLLDQKKATARARRAFRDLHRDNPEPDEETEAEIRRKRNFYLATKKMFIASVSSAKSEHWNAFLTRESPDTIYKAFRYTSTSKTERIPAIKNSQGQLQTDFQGKCNALREGLFVPPPQTEAPDWSNYLPKNWEWPLLTKEELLFACTAAAKGSTPGPDTINAEIILKALNVCFDQMFFFYSTLFNIGYHPRCWCQATGCVLKKQGKDDYSAPKSYRVISLLNCLGKVSERIMAYRTGELAETTNLIHTSQMGGRKKKSAIDAALKLQDFVQQAKRGGLIPSTLFLDIKGAYDYVALNQLLHIMMEKGLPFSLISWTFSFLNYRIIRLSFDGDIEMFVLVPTGIPQGSPVSPILFLIYISNLFSSNAVFHISYVDDVTISVATRTLEENMRILQREADKLMATGLTMSIQFDPSKIDLMHWIVPKKKNKTKEMPDFILPDGTPMPAKKTVKWLGIHFDAGLTFKEHVHTRVNKAKQAFYRLQRITNSERGLSALATRQIYLACVQSVAPWGCQLYWHGQPFIKLAFQKLQNLGMRKILGTFKTTPAKTMEIEAALPPPEVLLHSYLQDYAFRVHKLSPQHPIKQLFQKVIDIPPIVRDGAKTQVQILVETIEHLTTGDLETIKHHHFPPWRRRLPYTVTVSPLNKDEQAKAHNQLIEDLCLSDTTAVYSDASSIPGGQGVGVGFAAYSLNSFTPSKFQEFGVNIGKLQLVYNGELEGIVSAAEHMAELKEKNHSYLLFADNQAALKRLATPSDNPGQSWQIRLIEAATQIEQNQSTVELHWVPGHKDVEGNETADALAKRAAQSAPSSGTKSLAMLGMQINEKRTKMWFRVLRKHARTSGKKHRDTYKKNFGWTLRKQLAIPPGTPKAVSSAYYQLRIGHGYFNAYRKRFKLSDTGLCSCGVEQTPEHLLLSCTWYSEQRKTLKATLKKRRRLKLRDLFSSSVARLATLKFIKSTRISTRRWLLHQDGDV